jgi:hypothetical protein
LEKICFHWERLITLFQASTNSKERNYRDVSRATVIKLQNVPLRLSCEFLNGFFLRCLTPYYQWLLSSTVIDTKKAGFQTHHMTVMYTCMMIQTKKVGEFMKQEFQRKQELLSTGTTTTAATELTASTTSTEFKNFFDILLADDDIEGKCLDQLINMVDIYTEKALKYLVENTREWFIRLLWTMLGCEEYIMCFGPIVSNVHDAIVKVNKYITENLEKKDIKILMNTKLDEILNNLKIKLENICPDSSNFVLPGISKYVTSTFDKSDIFSTISQRVIEGVEIIFRNEKNRYKKRIKGEVRQIKLDEGWDIFFNGDFLTDLGKSFKWVVMSHNQPSERVVKSIKKQQKGKDMITKDSTILMKSIGVHACKYEKGKATSSTSSSSSSTNTSSDLSKKGVKEFEANIQTYYPGPEHIENVKKLMKKMNDSVVPFTSDQFAKADVMADLYLADLVLQQNEATRAYSLIHQSHMLNGKLPLSEYNHSAQVDYLKYRFPQRRGVIFRKGTSKIIKQLLEKYCVIEDNGQKFLKVGEVDEDDHIEWELQEEILENGIVKTRVVDLHLVLAPLIPVSAPPLPMWENTCS